MKTYIETIKDLSPKQEKEFEITRSIRQIAAIAMLAQVKLRKQKSS